MKENFEEKILLEALLNAREYHGKTNTKAILGKLIAKHPELKSKVKVLIPQIERTVNENFPMEVEFIEQRIRKLDPNAIAQRAIIKVGQKRKAEKRKRMLFPLPNAKKGKVIVRYAPEPSKFPHIGHALNFLINSLYAEKYDGQRILRFDDTNPANVNQIYYTAIKRGLKWAGIGWDKEVVASKHLAQFYTETKRLLEANAFFVCQCAPEKVRQYREDGKACECREFSQKKRRLFFERMQQGKFKPNEIIVRLTGDMNSKNPVMRDPVLFRIVQAKHPLLDEFYPVWPTYDFASSFLDNFYGVTHIIRSGEFGMMRQQLQTELIKLFGGKIPTFFSFGRYNILGSPTKGRVVKTLVEQGIVTGWDDIRLHTIEGWRKRGIQREVLGDLIRENGTTPQSTVIDWSQITRFNRKILEPKSKRFFFVRNPIKLEIAASPQLEFVAPLHPNLKLGNRVQIVKESVYIDSTDLKLLKPQITIRLKDLYNIVIQAIHTDKIMAKYSNKKINLSSIKKIQWVSEPFIFGSLEVPELLEKKKGVINKKPISVISGYFEQSIRKIDRAEIVQLERVGFAKLWFVNGKIKGHLIHS